MKGMGEDMMERRERRGGLEVGIGIDEK